jgi:hypothetical protein
MSEFDTVWAGDAAAHVRDKTRAALSERDDISIPV